MQANLQVADTSNGASPYDLLLPTQHFGRRRKQEPVERLMIAVLHDALDCVEKYRDAKDSKGRQLFRDACRWFMAHEGYWPYSFECICSVLDLEADAVRKRLRLGPQRRPLRHAGPQHKPRSLGTPRASSPW